MTVLTDAPRANDYVGDGTTTQFAYTFLIFAGTDLLVTQNSSLLMLNTHYTVSGVGEGTGGTVTCVVPPPLGATIAIRSDVPVTQGTRFPEGYRFPGRTVEATLDRLTVLMRQFKDRLRHGVFSPDSETLLDLILPARVAGKVWGWNDALTAIVNKDQAPAGPQGPQGLQGVPGAGAAPTVTDGVTSVAAPSSMEFLTASGFTVTNPSVGVARVTVAVIPPGLLAPYGGGTAPTGWLLCDGAAVNRTTFAALFTAIGVAFGVGNGTTTFNVPDLRSRFPLGAGVGPGLTARSIAAVGGEETHILTAGEMPSHRHGLTMQNTSPLAATGGNPVIQVLNIGTPLESELTGGGTAHNTMPPFAVVLYIIKT